jgi:hypothetical protein
MTTIALSSPADDANIIREERSDGSVWLRSTKPLAPFSHRVTERLEHWAQFTPDRPFLAQRAPEGWRTITYRSTLNAVRSIGQALLDRGLEKANPVLAPSGNGIEHALLSLACMHVGIVFCPVSTAYSTTASDFTRLRDIVDLTRPSLVFASDGDACGRALRSCIPPSTEVVIVKSDAGRPATAFHDLLATTAIPQEMWEKWVFIAASAGITCLMRAAIGDIVAADAADLSTALFAECAAIAAKEGFPPRAEFAERTRTMLTAPASPMTASMLRDIERGPPVEADRILGDLLRRAGSEADKSLLRVAYSHTKAYETRARNAAAPQTVPMKGYVPSNQPAKEDRALSESLELPAAFINMSPAKLPKSSARRSRAK